jgi:hypothetical protein
MNRTPISATERRELPFEQELRRNTELHADHLQLGRALRVRHYATAAMFVMLGIASLVFASGANAAELARLPNQAGGEIVLTDARAKACPPEWPVAIGRTGSGQTVSGCWTYTETGYVYVRWSDGDVRMYPLLDFEFLVQPPARRSAI